ncbi:DUF397 domain-containing protein [Streptomyces sp. NPDC026206]|uniref:DUF397 domain-containing protein n=1 Tax=Streptomyces sp. NPDC026206 TaxID=3157089 RepID=UPI0033FD6B4F
MPNIRTTSTPASTQESAWAKSSYSNAGQNCVEVTGLTARSAQVGVRDSKDKSVPALHVMPWAWASFIHEVQSGQFG